MIYVFCMNLIKIIGRDFVLDFFSDLELFFVTLTLCCTSIEGGIRKIFCYYR